jgi:ubiquinone/menaquinone biosynthesis C-methylase UbiE
MGLDETLSGQIDYYRRRAAEYDETSVGSSEQGSREFGELIDKLEPAGDVLEIACGTGLWTQHLAPRARTLTAIDSSPEMIELARARTGDRGAEFVVADVFAWRPARSYDSVFFGFWLSHVPPQRFAPFWSLLDRCLNPGGRVLFFGEGAPRE